MFMKKYFLLAAVIGYLENISAQNLVTKKIQAVLAEENIKYFFLQNGKVNW